MAIVRNSYYGTSRLETDISPGTASRYEPNEYSEPLDSVDDGGVSEDDDTDVDSGMGSDEFDLSELGEPGAELCQVANQSFSFPLALYDLPSLGMVLSLETWNACLTEEERFALAKYLPDLDQENFAVTLKELFSGRNFQFGNPLDVFFNQLKGGLCDPSVVLYRRGLNLFQLHLYYHQLCKYQNSMVGSIVQMREAWKNCAGYGIEERLRLLNILRSRRSLCSDRNGDLGSEADLASSDSIADYRSRMSSTCRGALRSSKKASFNSLAQKSGMTIETVWSGKEKAKGILKVAVPKFSVKKENVVESGSGAGDNYLKYPDYEMVWQGDPIAGLKKTAAKSGSLKSKRKDLLKSYESYDPDLQSDFGEEDSARMSSYLSRSKKPRQALSIASSDCNAFDKMKKLKQADKNRKNPTNERLQNQVANRSQIDLSDAKRPYRHGRVYDEASSPYHSGTFRDTNIRCKEWKTEDHFITNKSNSDFDFKVSSDDAPAAQSGSHLHSEYRKKSWQGKLRSKSSHRGGVGKEYSIYSPTYAQSEETQSDSSDQVEECRNMYPYAMQSVYSSVAMEEVPQSGIVKPENKFKLSSKLPKSDKKISVLPDIGSHAQAPEMEAHSQKIKKIVKPNEASHLDDGKPIRKGHVRHFIEKSQPALLDFSASDRKRKGVSGFSQSLKQADGIGNHVGGIKEEHVESLDVDTGLEDIESQPIRSGNKNLISSDYALQNKQHEVSRIPILGCNSLPKKLNGKGGEEHLDEFDEPIQQHSGPKKQTEDSFTMKKKGKRKADAVVVASSALTPEPIIADKGSSELEMDVKTHKKPFTLITPTIHTGFSFSIMHLLTSVRKALITAQVDDTEDICSHLRKEDASEHGGRNNLPFLRVQEIVSRVRSNPGDPCILETPEPLQDLVRGVLKIFSSKTAPLGAKGWKALVLYEKSNKSWSWVGPIPSSSSEVDNSEEENSAEAWGISHKMLVKMVDAFANWLKGGQETLQQIGSLPTPPAMMLVLDYKDRFRDLRAQKSLNTISPNSDEVRAYFRKEELLRYSIPDRAFQYTAVDGRKSIVAPLRRGGGKPTSKARDHFMLKPNRPPHVTILCLVRDAAARLPGSIGTRADVCTLIRDSQYIVEDVTDAQVNQVVSGALDRLHYERDPCVQFDGDRKLWVYLHRDREEEDFEDDGTSSTKKWKRQRKEARDHSEMAPMNDSNYLTTRETAAGGSSGYDFNPDTNFVSSAINIGEKDDEFRPNADNFQSYVDPSNHERGQSNPIRWGKTGLSQLQETKMLCQENSTNQDFDDEAFSRERPVGLFSAGLF